MAHSTKKLGMMFTASAWVLAFLVMALAFSKILDSQNNPNQSVSTLQTGEFQEVVLTRNRSGHYVFDGEIHLVLFDDRSKRYAVVAILIRANPNNNNNNHMAFQYLLDEWMEIAETTQDACNNNNDRSPPTNINQRRHSRRRQRRGRQRRRQRQGRHLSSTNRRGK